MPKSEVSKLKMFRDFSVIKDRYIKANYLKYVNLVFRDMRENYDVTEAEIRFMLFIYDLEFFTIDYVAEHYFYSKRKVWQRLIRPLEERGYIYKHFKEATEGKELEGYMFREERGRHYRKRYALSQTGRLLVSKIYRKFEGDEQINVPIDNRFKGHKPL
jgi:hypothetical protein